MRCDVMCGSGDGGGGGGVAVHMMTVTEGMAGAALLLVVSPKSGMTMAWHFEQIADTAELENCHASTHTSLSFALVWIHL